MNVGQFSTIIISNDMGTHTCTHINSLGISFPVPLVCIKNAISLSTDKSLIFRTVSFCT